MKASLVPAAHIERAIIVLRGQKVMVDADLAVLYGVPTKRLNEQVKRNSARFPEDFVFRLPIEEKAQVVAICDHLTGLRFSRSLPYAFTEHGAIQAANVLNSARAVEMSVHVVRAFVRLRELIASNRELAARLDQLEKKLGTHDQAIARIMQAIRQLMTPPESKKRPIEFVVPEEKEKKHGD